MADCNISLVLYYILTETSLQIPGIGFGQSSGGQNSPLGCIIRTPLVVKPSTSFSPFSHLVAFSPRKIFLDESKPAAKIMALRSSSPRLDNIRQANREIVDWVFILSVGRFPGTVSITTKSIGDSELRPICNYFLKN